MKDNTNNRYDQQQEENMDDEKIITIGRFVNSRMLKSWFFLLVLSLCLTFIGNAAYQGRKDHIMLEKALDQISFLGKTSYDNGINEYAWIPPTMFFVDTVLSILVIALFFTKTTVTLIKKDGNHCFQMQGLFFNANTGPPISINVYQSMTRDVFFIYSHLVMEIHTQGGIYTLAERLDSGFNTGLPISINIYWYRWYQLASSQADGFVADIARKLGLIKY